jgi:hypothetical protein
VCKNVATFIALVRTLTSVNVCTFTLHKAVLVRESCRVGAPWQGGIEVKQKHTREELDADVASRLACGFWAVVWWVGDATVAAAPRAAARSPGRVARGVSAGSGDDTAVETADTPLISDLFFARTKNFLEDLPRDDAAHFSWDVPSRRVPGPHGTVIEETRAQAHASQVSRDE